MTDTQGTIREKNEQVMIEEFDLTRTTKKETSSHRLFLPQEKRKKQAWKYHAKTSRDDMGREEGGTGKTIRESLEGETAGVR